MLLLIERVVLILRKLCDLTVSLGGDELAEADDDHPRHSAVSHKANEAKRAVP